MGTMWPKSGSYEFDSNGVAADGALAYFYQAGTSTPLTVYSDGAESTPHEDPVEADGNGRWPLVFVPYAPTYKFVLKTAGGTTLFTADNVPNPEPFDESFEVDADAQYNTGDYIFVGKNGTRSGAVRCNGRTIGDASSSATERANADSAALFAYLWNNYADGQAAVSTGRGATAVADYAAHKTVALPDHRGASLVGFEDMGNTNSGLLGGVPAVSGTGTTAGSIFGANTHIITEAQLAAHTHAISITSGTESADHTHAISITSQIESVNHHHTATTESGGVDHTHNYSDAQIGVSNPVASTAAQQVGNTDATRTTTGASAFLHTHTLTTSNESAQHTHLVSGTSAGKSATHTHLVSGTSASTGSGTAHNIVSRSVLVTVLMKL